jgi:hypothetical protein
MAYALRSMPFLPATRNPHLPCIFSQQLRFRQNMALHGLFNLGFCCTAPQAEIRLQPTHFLLTMIKDALVRTRNRPV